MGYEYNWINPEEFSPNSFLLMDRWIINMIIDNYGTDDEFISDFSVLLKYNPAVQWYLIHKCPEKKDYMEKITSDVSKTLTKDEVKKHEIDLIKMLETTMVYTAPNNMEKDCDYIVNWDENSLFKLADFTDKVVLDVGSGTGRLAFAAAKKARRVYASEPTDMLREYMRDKIKNNNISNIKVLDGFVANLPFEDNTFDIVMSGHVVGDDYENEIAELTRVVKNGGYIIDCIGEDNRKRKPDEELLKRGFEMFYHKSKTGGDIYRYRKHVFK